MSEVPTIEYLTVLKDEINTFLVDSDAELTQVDKDYLKHVRECIVGVVNLSGGTNRRGFVWPRSVDGAQKANAWLEAKKSELNKANTRSAPSENQSGRSSYSSLGKRAAEGPPEQAQQGRTKKRYPLLEHHINHVLQTLEHQPQSKELQDALFLLKEAIRLTSFGAPPRTMLHHLRRVQSLIPNEGEVFEEIMIVFDCLNYLDDMYP